jgi:hypothetical protein
MSLCLDILKNNIRETTGIWNIRLLGIAKDAKPILPLTKAVK